MSSLNCSIPDWTSPFLFIFASDRFLRETLTLSLALIQQGVHPEVGNRRKNAGFLFLKGLAKIIQELRGSSRNKTEDVPMDES